jgi:hypothetical protein
MQDGNDALVVDARVTPIKEDANFLVSGPRQGRRSFEASRLKTYPAFVAAHGLLSSEALTITQPRVANVVLQSERIGESRPCSQARNLSTSKTRATSAALIDQVGRKMFRRCAPVQFTAYWL